MTSNTTDSDAGAMLDEARDLCAQLQALAGRAEGAYAELSGGEDVPEPTVVQRVLMAIGAAAYVPLADLVGGLDEAQRVQAGEIPPFEEDDTVLTAEVLVAIAQSAISDEDEVIRAAEVIAEVEHMRLDRDESDDE